MTAAGAPVAGVAVQLFAAAGSFLGRSLQTDLAGNAEFRLPAGEYDFRADLAGGQYWSQNVTVAAGSVTTVEIAAGT